MHIVRAATRATIPPSQPHDLCRCRTVTLATPGIHASDGDPAPRRPGRGGVPRRPAAAADVWLGEPVATDSAYVRHFQQLAARLEMAVAVTYLEAWEPAPRNTVSVIDRSGRLVHTYAKVHTCAFALPEAALTPGESFGTRVLDTAAGDVVIGTMICYDREVPESARAHMLGGAEVILT